MGGCDLPDGAAHLGQFDGSRHGVRFIELVDYGAVRGFFHGIGLPYEWVTNFVIRKCAHFTEYMVLGILATRTFDIEGRRTFDVLLPTAVFLLLIPSIDETIQLFVPGRAGMITDVTDRCVRSDRAGVGASVIFYDRSYVPKRPLGHIAWS